MNNYHRLILENTVPHHPIPSSFDALFAIQAPLVADGHLWRFSKSVCLVDKTKVDRRMSVLYVYIYIYIYYMGQN